jgi:hypothetical protein
MSTRRNGKEKNDDGINPESKRIQVRQKKIYHSVYLHNIIRFQSRCRFKLNQSMLLVSV